MKANEMREKTIQDLDSLVIEQLMTLFKLRIKKHTKQSVSISEMRKLRKTIARAKTIKHEKIRGINHG